MGAGDDTFQWDPGDGNDTIEGQAGNDTMLFNGANIAEKIDLSANGDRLRFTRDIANIAWTRTASSRSRSTRLGGVDHVTVHNLAGTDVTKVNADLGGRRTARPTRSIAEGTAGADVVSVTGTGGVTTLNGLAATIEVPMPRRRGPADRRHARRRRPHRRRRHRGQRHDRPRAATRRGCSSPACRRSSRSRRPAADQAFVNGLGGNDAIDGRRQAAQAAGLTDRRRARQRHAQRHAGRRDPARRRRQRLRRRQPGNDFAQLGAGDDTFQWDPGDGSDTINGDTGNDTMLFNGANIAERIDMSANGSFLRFTRDIATIVMDTREVEQVASARSAAPTS